MPRADKLSKKDLQHLAMLARIGIPRKEEGPLLEQLNRVLEYFKKLGEIDGEAVPPSYHVIDVSNVFRKDEPQQSNYDDVIKNVPKMRQGYVKAPRMAWAKP